MGRVLSSCIAIVYGRWSAADRRYVNGTYTPQTHLWSAVEPRMVSPRCLDGNKAGGKCAVFIQQPLQAMLAPAHLRWAGDLCAQSLPGELGAPPIWGRLTAPWRSGVTGL